MFWSWNRKASAAEVRAAALVDEVAALRAEVSAQAAEVRGLRLEWAETSDRLYRHMKRGEQAARKVAGASQGILGSQSEDEVPSIPSGTPLRGRRSVWGARGRRALSAAENGHGGE